MNKLLGWLGAGFAVAGGTYLFVMSQKLKELRFRIQYIHIDTKKTSTRNGIHGKIGLRVYNPNNINLVFQKFVGHLVYMGTKEVAIDNSSRSYAIPSNGYATIPLHFHIPLFFFGVQTITLIADLLLGKPLSFSGKQVSLVGHLKMKGLVNMPINYTFDFGEYLNK